MSYNLATIRQMARRWGWLVVLPALVVCAADNSTGTAVAPPPGIVSDLAVGTTSDVSATISFTQVENGTFEPANYEVRFAASPISWSSASSARSGTCATPLMGTSAGSPLSCTILGLSPSTAYDFQIRGFRGNLTGKVVFGAPSNIAAGSTSGSEPPPPVVTTVTVSPGAASIGVGTTSALEAIVKDQNGNVMTGQTASWSTSDANVATVNSSGVVSGVAAGSATITATVSGKTGTATITVTAGPPPPPIVTTVSVTPASASVVAGSTVNLQATVKDQYGNAMTGQSLIWSTDNSAAATVNSSGVVTGVAAGSATITATSSGKAGTAAITVTPAPPVVTTVSVTPASASVVAGSTVNLQATVKDQYGNVMTGQTVTWSTNNSAAATVNSSGVVTGVAAGSATITATSSGQAGTAAITVTAAPPPPVVTTVTVSPGSASVVAGSTVGLQATVKDQYGNVMTGQSITWSTDNSAAATVNSSGVVTGVAAGSATITATTSGKSGTAAITVTAAPPPPPPGAVADPTLLPKATGQHPGTGTYGRSLAAGQTYTDPLTAVPVLKLTSASVPSGNNGVYAGYSEGGPNISQPWVGNDGNTYYTAFISDGWLVDIRYDTFTSSNWRRAPTSGETRATFSLNPATPRILFYVDPANDKTVHRYNTATNANAETGIFPYTTSAAGGSLLWLQVNLNDEWLVGMLNSNVTTVAVRLSDGLERIIPKGVHDVDEPHIDREFPIVYISTNDLQNLIINLETGAVVPETDPAGVDFADHATPLRGKVVAINWAANGVISADRFGTVKVEFTPSPTDWAGDYHMAGQWVFNNLSQYFIVDQWKRNGNYPIYQGMIGFVSIGGDVRILAAHDATGVAYSTGGQPHPTLSPDGKLVMWTSNMNGSSRFDVFVARVPAR